MAIAVAGGAVAAAILLTTGTGSATQAAQAPAPQGTLRLVPDDLQDTSWLQTLAEAQVKAVAGGHGVPRFPVHRSAGRERHRLPAPHRRRRRQDLQGGALRPRQRPRDRGRRRRRPDSTSTSSTRSAATSSGRMPAAAGSRTSPRRPASAVAGKIGVSASFADIDNDGDADLYVTTVRGGNVLFENDGQRPLPRHLRGLRPRLRRALVGRRVLRLRPRRPARPVPRQRRTVHDRHDRGRRLQVLRRRSRTRSPAT